LIETKFTMEDRGYADELADENLLMPDFLPHFTDLPAERARLDVPIGAECKGYHLLQRMGWVVGSGLGKRGSGRVDPIPFASNTCQLGLGKAAEVERVAEETTETRKAPMVEILLREQDDPSARAARQERNAHNARVQDALKEATAEFYCECCRKQYSNAMEYSGHLDSYDHHHVKRFKEMREVEAARTRHEREAKEARKALKADRQRREAPQPAETNEGLVSEPEPRPAAPQPLPIPLAPSGAPLKFSMLGKPGATLKVGGGVVRRVGPTNASAAFGNDIGRG
jgi:hypothetical protein